MQNDHARKIRHSALWAAYGDAMGFITELADAQIVTRRANSNYIADTLPWSRLLGGRFGAVVQLPSGCYSDDTQLRLATSRAIRSDGSFDIDSFAKVELPTFDAYALGAGRSTKTAAQSLASTSVNWFSNFYDKASIRYLDAGGNGVAMRIQPHVWCTSSKSLEPNCLIQIIRNCITTHGHPRALAGALIHAIHLSSTIWENDIPAPITWCLAVDKLENIRDIITSDGELATIWLPTWETRSRQKWDTSWHETLNELRAMLSVATDLATQDSKPDEKYLQLIKALDGTNKEVRGDAIRTAIFSLFLAWNFRDRNPHSALKLAVNCLQTDTDSIATLAGALLGATSQEPPLGTILDSDYICREADRMVDIASGRKPSAFNYPNLLTWRPPRSQLDVVTLQQGKIVVAGLGVAIPSGKVFRAKSSDIAWEILELEYGQTLVIKRRAHLTQLEDETNELFSQTDKENRHRAKPDHIDATPPEDANKDLDTLTTTLITSGFPAERIGHALLKFAELDTLSTESAIAFAAIIVKARRARLLRGKTL